MLVLEFVLGKYPPHTDANLLRLAALACDNATQDPIDLAILDAARNRAGLANPPPRLRFLPFDPATKRSEAFVSEPQGVLHVVKGAPAVIASLAGNAIIPGTDLDHLAGPGYRVLAVAAGPEGVLQLVGLVALQDPPRDDSYKVVQALQRLGVRVVMVTGDTPATAAAVAAQVGIKGRVCSADEWRRDGDGSIAECAVFASVFPEDKFHLVQALQQGGHVTARRDDEHCHRCRFSLRK